MARYAYERLSAQDASFLWAEDGSQSMHVGGLAIVEAAPLRRGGDAIDIDAFRRSVEAVLHWIPRYRQKLAWTPLEGWPVWVDDRQFDIGYHIRHIALPRPGSRAQLKEMAARINARALDRDRPLWEIWVIEGVEDGEQVAVLNKIHHCMIDGAAGADLTQILMSPSPSQEVAAPVPYMPRPAPSGGELLRDSIGSWLGAPLNLASSVAAALVRPDAGEAEEVKETTGPGIGRRLRAMADMAGYALRPASETPLNGELSPHRRLEWLTMPLDDVRELRRVLGCTINDVVLATVCGAMRRFLFRRRVDGSRLDFRVAAPVSTRREGHERRQGNHVSSWVVPLPLGEEDPLEQLITLRARTEALKRNESALALETLMHAFEYLPPRPLPDRSPASQHGAGDRSLQLRGQALLGLQRRLRDRAGPRGLRQRHPNGLRAAPGGNREALHGAEDRPRCARRGGCEAAKDERLRRGGGGLRVGRRRVRGSGSGLRGPTEPGLQLSSSRK